MYFMRTVILFFFTLLFTMCSTSNVQYRDDFRPASEGQKKQFLSDLNANSETFSVIILTKGYKGELVIISNEKKTLYKGTTITNLNNGIAHSLRIDNSLPTTITDKISNKEVIIESKKAKQYKFIYIMKDNAETKNPYKITYSNTLRPM